MSAANVNGWTPGPWYADMHGNIWRIDPKDRYENGGPIAGEKAIAVAHRGWYDKGTIGFPVEANARLIAAAPVQHAEMVRYLPIIERAEADPELWTRLTEGTGIATANGYRAAIASATGEQA